MSEKNTGGPAFPLTRGSGPIDEFRGMSLRDWFAGQALIGEMRENGEDLDWLPMADRMAKRCYAVADAMIKEREK